VSSRTSCSLHKTSCTVGLLEEKVKNCQFCCIICVYFRVLGSLILTSCNTCSLVRQFAGCLQLHIFTYLGPTVMHCWFRQWMSMSDVNFFHSFWILTKGLKHRACDITLYAFYLSCSPDPLLYGQWFLCCLYSNIVQALLHYSWNPKNCTGKRAELYSIISHFASASSGWFIRAEPAPGPLWATDECSNTTAMLDNAKFWSFYCKTWYSEYSKWLPPVAFWQL